MGPELAVFRAIIELFWPTLCLAKMAILNTVHAKSFLVNDSIIAECNQYTSMFSFTAIGRNEEHGVGKERRL